MDDLRGIELRIAERLQELEPLVEEYEELQKLAERLHVDVEAATSKPPRRAERSAGAATAGARKNAGSRRRRKAVAGGTRAVGAERRTRILELVAEQPGVTVSDVAKELGVDRTSVHRVVRKLQQNGELKKSGRGLQPV